MERNNLGYSGIFLDSSKTEEASRWKRIIGGITTNPVIMYKDGVVDENEQLSKLVKVVGPSFPISIEIPNTHWSEKKMISYGKGIFEKYPKNAVIKVPMDPNEPEKAFEVIYKLGQEGVRINATIGISMGQLVGAAEALRENVSNEDSYISLFWARRDEARIQIINSKTDMIVQEKAKEGISLTDEEKYKLREDFGKEITDASATLAFTLSYLKSHSLAAKVIVGSVRNIQQIEKAFSIGADIVTIPPQLLKEWMYTKRAEETVDQFNSAYRDMVSKRKK